MTKKVKTKMGSKSHWKIVLFILLAVALLSSIAINCFALYKLTDHNTDNPSTNSQSTDNSNSSNSEVSKPHFVDSSEIIKSKTYYTAFHQNNFDDDLTHKTEVHLCLFDKEAEENNSVSETITFKIVIEAADKVELTFNAYSGATWRSWCNSSFNHFTLENQDWKLSIAKDGHIIFN